MTDDTTTLDDTTAFGREPDVAEPIDTNTADVIRERTPDIPEDGNRQNTGRDSSRPAPQAP
ncbi:MAG: hypothetical protein ABS46_01715 [Cytophagaceae bacterium SCN 52-12]|nr:MAG: hypothetical protein ABS46_01715 [Cytophagaceae bacterium SCN 52-12]